MRGCKGSSPTLFYGWVHPPHATTSCSASPMERQTHRGRGSHPGSHMVSDTECRLEPGLQAQCSLPRQWGAEDISLNHRVKFRRRRKKSSSRRSSRGWSPAQQVPGLWEGGNDAAWARGSLRSAIRRESACGGSQDCRGSGKDSGASSWGDSTGAPCAGHSGAQDPLHLGPERDPTHIHTQASTQAGHTLSTWMGSRSLLSREGVSLEQGNPGRPMRGGGHEQESRPSCRPGPRSEAVDTASSLPPL